MAKATCFIEGRAGADPEIRFAKNGNAYAKFNVAVTERVKEGEEWVDGNTTWYAVTAWKHLAEWVTETIRKGDLVNVSGRMKLDTWEDSEGAKRSGISVSADSVGLVKAVSSSKQSISSPF